MRQAAAPTKSSLIDFSSMLGLRSAGRASRGMERPRRLPAPAGVASLVNVHAHPSRDTGRKRRNGMCAKSRERPSECAKRRSDSRCPLLVIYSTRKHHRFSCSLDSAVCHPGDPAFGDLLNRSSPVSAKRQRIPPIAIGLRMGQARSRPISGTVHLGRPQC